jgi:hypothetical protein
VYPRLHSFCVENAIFKRPVGLLIEGYTEIYIALLKYDALPSTCKVNRSKKVMLDNPYELIPLLHKKDLV